MRNLAAIVLSVGVLAFLAGFPMYFVLSPRDSGFVWLLATSLCWGGPIMAMIGLGWVLSAAPKHHSALGDSGGSAETKRSEE